MDSFSAFMQRGSIPFTKFVIICNVVTLFLSVFPSFFGILASLMFVSSKALKAPWSIVTYPFIGFDVISVLFSGLWMWMCGGSLERAWLTRNFAALFFMVTAVSSLGLLLGSFIVGMPVPAFGLWLPLAGITVAFCMLNWGMEMCVWFIPMKAQYLMYLDMGITFLTYARIHPLVGVCALAGCGFAYAYIRWLRWNIPKPVSTVGWRGRQIEIDPTPAARNKRNWNPLSAFVRWKRKREFRRLMRQSGFKDEE